MLREALMHKHFQMVRKSNFNTLPVLSKRIKVCLGWDESPPTGHVVSCKSLEDVGLHTFLAMVGYCMKDNGEEHFEFVHNNVSTHDMNEGKMEHAKFGRMGLNNHVGLSHSNVFQRAHQWARFCMKKHLGATLPAMLVHMCKSGQFYS